jgi:hypothetical protein
MRTQMKERVFSKADSDGSGTVDKSELQNLFDNIAEKTGGTAKSAEEAFGAIDTNADGSISKEELASGMESLMPPPSSTVEFASKGRAGGPPAAGGASKEESSSTSTDPLDTNEDGVVSALERAAGDLKALLADLTGSANDAGADAPAEGGVGKTLSAFVAEMLQQYAGAATATSREGIGSSLSVSA